MGTLLLALDEVATVAPLPNLPKLITAGAGDGIQCLLGLQEPSQANRWGAEAGVITGGTTHIALYRGLRLDSYLSGIASLARQEMNYEVRITVRPNVVQGTRYADEPRLLTERRQLEAARSGASTRLRNMAVRRVARSIVASRLRSGILPRVPDASDPTSGIIQELYDSTHVELVPTRRLRVEAADIAQGDTGTFFLLTGAHGCFRDFWPWPHDPLWNEIIRWSEVGPSQL